MDEDSYTEKRLMFLRYSPLISLFCSY